MLVVVWDLNLDFFIIYLYVEYNLNNKILPKLNSCQILSMNLRKYILTNNIKLIY